ncbi:uncharacterized protein EV422DRAFT_562873 [Fimicolochytrium jonesii]|uniref:uncharacterized protein n=1 Tax=Fimicolochytrium jonesii TaxID=1396493 RepID=UPI0022FE78F2|nr:uncharacterized protein EV422DRAFT_562873 [Fimicolochytrium jonesii]KAI8826815.1 hypothetical protein EV422DRAFT_562873 [Fimicolochytrium jonesii]
MSLFRSLQWGCSVRSPLISHNVRRPQVAFCSILAKPAAAIHTVTFRLIEYRQSACFPSTNPPTFQSITSRLGARQFSNNSNPFRTVVHFTFASFKRTTLLTKSVRLAKPATPLSVSPATTTHTRGVRSNWYQPANTGFGSTWGRASYGRGKDPFSGETVLYGIISVNVVVFLMWMYANANSKQYGDHKWLKFMRENFLLNAHNCIDLGRWWTMLTCAFSHSNLMHILLNMFVLYNFAPSVIEIVGPRNFLGLYLLSGLAASVGSLINQVNTARQRGPPTYSLGASGCVTGVTLLFALTYPRASVYLFGLVPVPAIIALGGFVAYDAYKSYTGTSGGTDTAGHLGGAAMGAAYWWFLVRRGRF